METPLEHYPELAKTIGVSDLYLKREDLSPLGSHKGRSIPVMIDHYVSKGERRFAISSSGNAALAAALHIQELNRTQKEPLELEIYVGGHAAANKVEKIKTLTDEHIRFYVKERPLQALSQATNDGMRSLRQSTDDEALKGYQSLAEEIAKDVNKGAVFVATSSGTTVQALAEYFSKKKLPMQVHIVQTTACHPISEVFEPAKTEEDMSIADAIVDQTAYRKKPVVELVRKTGGYGWTASNEDIEMAQELIRKHAGLEVSANGALSVAGAMQAAYAGYEIDGPVVCVIGGE